MANRWYKGWWVSEDEYRRKIEEETTNSNKFWGALIICFILYSFYVYFFYNGKTDGKDIIALIICLIIGFVFNRIGSIIYKLCLAIITIVILAAIIIKLYNYKPHKKDKTDLPVEINRNQNITQKENKKDNLS